MKKIYLKDKRKYQSIASIIKKRYYILMGFLCFFMCILLVSLFQIQIIKYPIYKKMIFEINHPIIEGESAPRGRIYDRNHRLIVDNKPVKTIVYKRRNDVSKKEEIELAYYLGSHIEVPYTKLYDRNLKEFWLQTHEEEARRKITEEEWDLYTKRKLTYDDLEELKIERITQEELSIYQNQDKEAAYIYYLMNKGYYYTEKEIKVDVPEEEYAFVVENLDKLKGFSTKINWERVYPYGEVFRSILGSVSSSEYGIPFELKDQYLEKGYSLNDRVGLNYLEYQYENFLKGTKDQYFIHTDGENELIKEGKRGNDIVLTIDIELQKEVEKILEEQLLSAKEEPNTEYYDRSYVVITEPNTGEILAMAGKQIYHQKFYDVTPDIVTSPVVVGSVIKGASQIVGYNTGALQIGEVRDDSCLIFSNSRRKCSFRYNGMIDDIDALKYSSNTYQYHTAIKVGKSSYSYNSYLSLDESAFDIYRNTFHEFGLGIKTGIDLPVESAGYVGMKKDSELLLDFATGQYDTYTAIQLSEYIGTIANSGKRMQLHLLKEVYSPEESLKNCIKKIEPKVLGTVNTSNEYMQRVQMGFHAVLNGGTGTGSMSLEYDPAGKTGTSETFLDTDEDGYVDLETVSNTFVAYAPYENPRVTFTVISPNITHFQNETLYQTYVNRRISREVTKKFFEIYQ